MNWETHRCSTCKNINGAKGHTLGFKKCDYCTMVSRKWQKKHEERLKELNELRKQLYYENREEILEKNKEKVSCPFCNSTVAYGSISSHKKSKKCLALRSAST